MYYVTVTGSGTHMATYALRNDHGAIGHLVERARFDNIHVSCVIRGNVVLPLGYLLWHLIGTPLYGSHPSWSRLLHSIVHTV